MRNQIIPTFHSLKKIRSESSITRQYICLKKTDISYSTLIIHTQRTMDNFDIDLFFLVFIYYIVIKKLNFMPNLQFTTVLWLQCINSFSSVPRTFMKNRFLFRRFTRKKRR